MVFVTDVNSQEKLLKNSKIFKQANFKLTTNRVESLNEN